MSQTSSAGFQALRLRPVGLLGALVGSMIMWSGCRRTDVNVVPVSGVVTLDDNPVEAAYVTFMPANGRPSVGLTDGEGRYSLRFTGKSKGAVIGTHRVIVTTKQDAMPDLGIVGVPERIPEWYNRRSELEIEVTRERKPYDLRLTTAKDARK